MSLLYISVLLNILSKEMIMFAFWERNILLNTLLFTRIVLQPAANFRGLDVFSLIEAEPF